jgi:serine/threonine-protein kinase HipA
VTEGRQKFDCKQFVIEWVKRDLLNVAFGNSDNHGRNTSLIKRPSGIALAPIYDFAPMKADPEGVIRSTIWGSPFEEGGRFDWVAIAKQLNTYIEAEELITELKKLANKLIGLRERLSLRGVAPQLLAMPSLQLEHLDDKLKYWQLI